MVVNGASATKELVQARTGRDAIELVRELYVEQRLSDREIADYLATAGAKVNRVTITRWRGEHRISRDDRQAPAVPA